MNRIQKFIFLVVICTFVGQSIQDNPLKRKSKFKCGECIAYGYNACLTLKDNTETTAYDPTIKEENMCYDNFGTPTPSARIKTY